MHRATRIRALRLAREFTRKSYFYETFENRALCIIACPVDVNEVSSAAPSSFGLFSSNLQHW